MVLFTFEVIGYKPFVSSKRLIGILVECSLDFQACVNNYQTVQRQTSRRRPSNSSSLNKQQEKMTIYLRNTLYFHVTLCAGAEIAMTPILKRRWHKWITYWHNLPTVGRKSNLWGSRIRKLGNFKCNSMHHVILFLNRNCQLENCPIYKFERQCNLRCFIFWRGKTQIIPLSVGSFIIQLSFIVHMLCLIRNLIRQHGYKHNVSSPSIQK